MQEKEKKEKKEKKKKVGRGQKASKTSQAPCPPKHGVRERLPCIEKLFRNFQHNPNVVVTFLRTCKLKRGLKEWILLL